ncbi:MAG TPA: transcriptional regulator [Methanosarcinaceae archaeon]|nr:transcriptional regulator [Methanosarcinaceae archaeon]
MKPPCEIMVQKILPAIRAELARVLIVEYDCTQQKVADILGLSRAAVSQYVSEKRGAEIDFSDETKEVIRVFATELLGDLSTKEKVKGMCTACKFVRKSGWLYKSDPGVEYCAICGDDE